MSRELGCTKHGVQWRVFFGALARLGFRVDEAASLTIADVDLDRCVITLDENKTDDPRAPTYGPDVMTGLRIWKERYRQGAKPTDPFFVRPDGTSIRVDGLAKFYREEFVRDAGIDRAELFRKTQARIKLRVHDLRGYFITYALAGGATEMWVMDRTGHKSSTMVNRYRRVARTAAEAGVGRPVPLHLAVPELAAAFTAANAAAKGEKKGQRRRRSARNHTASGSIAQSVELRTFNP
jgi:integrase